MKNRCVFIAIAMLAGSASAAAQNAAPRGPWTDGSLPYTAVLPASFASPQPPPPVEASAPYSAPHPAPSAAVRPRVEPIQPPGWPVIPASAATPLANTTQATTQYDTRHELPLSATGATATTPAVPVSDRLLESSWYTRADYFRWKERLDGADFVTEDGLVWTLGYVRRSGPERFRAELFGNNVDYSGGVQLSNGAVLPLESHTNYLGLRGEYDLLFEPDLWPMVTFVGGIGTRFWFRDLVDTTMPNGLTAYGYQETWWTIYPYLGLETTRTPDSGPELYGAARLGFTAITHEQANRIDVVLYPRPGVVALVEAGIRGQHFFLSAVAETMNWAESDEVSGFLQPASRMFTIGLKTGFSF
jgi:hypothetical protein